jgi:hypothetical protein
MKKALPRGFDSKIAGNKDETVDANDKKTVAD